MLYGLYLSGQGADAAAFHQAVLANNLANAQTTAFKRDIPVFRAHTPFDVEQMEPPAAPDTINDQTGGLSVEGTITDFHQGPLKTTGQDFDLALVSQRPAFFEVADGKQKFLTRNGKLSVNQDNLLVSSDAGLPVMSVDGEALEVPPNMFRLDVNQDGAVFSVDGANVRTFVGQLALIEPLSPELMIKEGNSLYQYLGKARLSEEAEVRQGMLEESDVDPVTGMVDLIQSSRGFELNMNLVRIQDEMVAQLLQTIPRK